MLKTNSRFRLVQREKISTLKKKLEDEDDDDSNDFCEHRQARFPRMLEQNFEIPHNIFAEISGGSGAAKYAERQPLDEKEQRKLRMMKYFKKMRNS